MRRARAGLIPRLLLVAAAAVLFQASPAAATFSIVAYDSVTQELGVAVQSRAFSVGMAVPWAEGGVGAIATQASTNESFGPLGLAMLRQGKSAPEVLRALIDADSGSAHRQVGVVDTQEPERGPHGKGLLVVGGTPHRNGILDSGKHSCRARRWWPRWSAPSSRRRGNWPHGSSLRLMPGRRPGGDKRGMQSAALLVVRPSDEYPEYRTRYIDLRVEDSKDPIRELRRVFGICEATKLAEAHLRFAEAYDKAGRKDLARVERERVGEALHRALERGENDASNLNGLAWTCATNDIYLAEALQAAERAVALEPKESGILDTLAEVHFRMGNKEKAIEVETQALALAPNDNYLKEQIARFQSGKR